MLYIFKELAASTLYEFSSFLLKKYFIKEEELEYIRKITMNKMGMGHLLEKRGKKQ